MHDAVPDNQKAENGTGWEIQVLCSGDEWKNCVVNSRTSSFVVFKTKEKAQEMLDNLFSQLYPKAEFRVYETLATKEK